MWELNESLPCLPSVAAKPSGSGVLNLISLHDMNVSEEHAAWQNLHNRSGNVDFTPLDRIAASSVLVAM